MKSTIIQDQFDLVDDIDIALDAYNKQQPGYVELKGYIYKLVDDNEKFVGGIEFRIRAEWLFIANIAVAETQRRKGIGKRMLLEVEEFAKSQGCSKSYLFTTNFQAPAFYQKCGYEIKYTREHNDARLNQHLLIKSL